MPETNEDRDRQVVPRWRSYVSTAKYGELCSLAEPGKKKLRRKHIEPLLDDWKREPGLSVAADVVSAAVVVGDREVAKEQAEFVLMSDSATTAAKTMAEQCLNGPGWMADSPVIGAHELPNHNEFRGAVNRTRKRLSVYPHNPVLWVHLALLFTTLGQREKAEHAMRVALGLAPSSRFVIRSASRMFLHHGDVDQAYYIMFKAASQQRDPWLLAGEIALCSVREKSSRFTKKALALLTKQDFSAFHLSELSGALATIEASNGRMKKAKVLSRQSLLNPAENAIAQVAWLDRKIGGFDWSELTAESIQSSEANAWAARQVGEWGTSLTQALKWQHDQPFSSRPANLAAYIASTAMDQFEKAESILRHALVCNPNDAVLSNNLAFVLAKQNRPDESDKILERQRMKYLTIRERICLIATEGLVAYRKGNAVKGRMLYQQAILGARDRNLRGLSAIALVYFAMEEHRQGSTSLMSLEKEAKQEVSLLEEPLRELFRGKLNRALRDQDG